MTKPSCFRLRRYRAFSRVSIMALFALVLSVGLLAGCGTLPNGRRWGQDATFFPGWQLFGMAARDAAFSYETWVPAAAALLLQIDDWDEEISEWAVDNTPIFGSPQDAEDASDYLRERNGHREYSKRKHVFFPENHLINEAPCSLLRGASLDDIAF